MKKLSIAGLLVAGLGAGAVVMANPYWHGGHGYGHMGGGPGHCWAYDGGAGAAGWQQVAQQRTAWLQEKLNLNESQQKAWKAYQETITANVKAMQERELVDFGSMTAPQRLEKQQQMVKERDERMNKHLTALKNFYGTLSPEQQQIFDAETGPMMGAGPGYGHRGGGSRWHRGGPR